MCTIYELLGMSEGEELEVNGIKYKLKDGALQKFAHGCWRMCSQTDTLLFYLYIPADTRECKN